MTPVEQVKPQLIEGLTEIIRVVVDEDLNAAVFFSSVLTELREAASETDLQAVFFNLSTTAFQGFYFSERSCAMIDRLLEQAQHIAQTFALDGQPPH